MLTAKKCLIEIDNVCKTFADGTNALVGVSLKIFDGDFIVIAGSNGSGKSVLMSIVADIEPSTSGKVINNDARVGLVFQNADSQILGETPFEDVAFGVRNLGLRKENLAERVNDALTKSGLIEKKYAPARFLSGGEKRRLAVAGVLALDCNVIIFDEPFANLDWCGVKQVCSILEYLQSEGKTVIVLTHELEKVLALANRFVVLDNGAIRFDGTPEVGLSKDLFQWGLRNPLITYSSIKDLVWRD
jgi:biotin transport system ATP-binding protein